MTTEHNTIQVASDATKLAVAADLVRCIIQKVAGKDIADSLSGVDVKSDIITTAALNVFQKKVQSLKTLEPSAQ